MPGEIQGKWLVFFGILCVLAGLLWMYWGKYLSFLGNLPGDFKWQAGNVKIYFPLTTMILISVVISLVMKLIKWLG